MFISKLGPGYYTKYSNNASPIKQQQTTTPPLKTTGEKDLPPVSAPLLQKYFVNFSGKKYVMNNDGRFEEKPTKGATVGQTKNKMSDIENNLSYYGEKLLEDSRALAKKYGHNEINQIHVLRAGLESVKNYIEQLDSGEITYDDESSFSIYSVFEDLLTRNVIKEQAKREKIKPIIEKEIKLLDEKLGSMPKSQTSAKNTKPGFTKDSTSRWWHTPQPVSDKTAPVSFANSLKIIWVLESSFLGLGDAWSINKIQRDGFAGDFLPSFLNSCTINGPVPSCTAATSTLAIQSSPALTLCPACCDKIFSAIV